MSLDLAWKIPYELRKTEWARAKTRDIYLAGKPRFVTHNGAHRVHFVDLYHARGPRVVGTGALCDLFESKHRIDSTGRDRGFGWAGTVDLVVRRSIPLEEIADPDGSTDNWQQGSRYVFSDKRGIPVMMVLATELENGAEARFALPGSDRFRERLTRMLADFDRYERSAAALETPTMQDQRAAVERNVKKGRARAKRALRSGNATVAERLTSAAEAERFLLAAMNARRSRSKPFTTLSY